MAACLAISELGANQHSILRSLVKQTKGNLMALHADTFYSHLKTSSDLYMMHAAKPCTDICHVPHTRQKVIQSSRTLHVRILAVTTVTESGKLLVMPKAGMHL